MTFAQELTPYVSRRQCKVALLLSRASDTSQNAIALRRQCKGAKLTSRACGLRDIGALHPPVLWPQVTKGKTFALNDLSNLDVDGGRESRAVKNESMEFATLAARIDTRWKVFKQTFVK